MTPMPNDPFAPQPDPLPVEGPKGGLADPRTRIIVIAAAVVALLVVAGVVVWLVLANLGKSAENAAVNAITASVNASVKPAATATGSVETTIEGNRIAIPVTNKDVFTSRDPFVPVLKALPSIVPSSTETTPAAEDLNVLVLENIVTNNNTLKALFRWNGRLVDEALEAGKPIPNSPWQVLSLTKTTATMLYGDVQVTLSIGEGVAKD